MKRLLFFMLAAVSHVVAAQDLLWYAYSDGQMTSNDYSYVQTNQEGNVFHCGVFTDTIHFTLPFDTVAYETLQDSTNVCFLRKLSSEGALEWQLILEAVSGSITARGIELDQEGNCYVYGEFRGSVDFDFGAGNLTVDHGTQFQAFVVKYSPSGNPLWVKSFLCNNYIYIADLAITGNGDVFIAGGYTGIADLNPGAATVSYENTNSFSDSFMVRLDASGNYIWSYSLVGPTSGSDQITKIVVGPDGNIYGAGNNKFALDVDPGPGTTTIPGNNSIGAFIFAINANMQLQFAYGFSGSGTRRITGICFDDEQNIYLSGEFPSLIDVDVFAGTTNLQAVTSLNDTFIAKYNSSMELLWAKQISGQGADRLLSLFVDGAGNCYAAGSYSNHPTDFDPGPGTFMLDGSSYAMPMIFKLDNNGTFLWARRVAADGMGRATDIVKNSDGILFVTGWISSSMDADLQDGYVEIPQPFTNDYYLLALEENICSALSVTLSETVSLDCFNAGTIAATPYGGTGPYEISWDDMPEAAGNTMEITAPGLFTATVSDAIGCSFSHSVYVSGPVLDTIDAVVSLAAGAFVPGFDNQLSIALDALGCTPLDGNIQMVLDTGLTFLSAIPAPAGISGDTLFWNYYDLFYDNAQFVTVNVNISTGYIAGDEIPIEVMLSANEPNEIAGNNWLVQHYTVVSSYDPNMIVVQPEGYTDDGFVLAGDVLTYTIHFQNTGDYYASFVSIRDTLSEYLKLNTLNLLSSSHPCEVQLMEDHVVKFFFDGLWLPGAFDEPASHGYLTFSIQIEDDAPALSVLSNRVGIYFDFNPPVITNTVTNTIFECSMMSSEIQPAYFMTTDELVTIDPQPAYTENYGWYIGQDLVSDASSFTPSSMLPGTYAMTLEISNPLCTASYDFSLGLTAPIPTCPGDFDEDGIVTVQDLIIYIGDFGCTSNCSADNNGDGVVNVNDLNTLLELFGVVCED